MSDKLKKRIFYGSFALLLLGLLCYIYFDHANPYVPHWLKVDENTSGIVITDEEALPPKDDVSSTNEPFHRLNINLATEGELVELETIGEVTAKKIIDYRENNGDFVNINELLTKEILTKRQFNAIKTEITV